MSLVVLPFPGADGANHSANLQEPGTSPGLGQLTADDFEIKTLGPCTIPSPVTDHLGSHAMHFVGRSDRVLFSDRLSDIQAYEGEAAFWPSFELAGPRDHIFFNPIRLRCGIVTCGGLCPGLNNVVRGIVCELANMYGVKETLGFRFGYEGMLPDARHRPTTLTPDSVAYIHHQGGTVLGSSRGNQDIAKMVDTLEENAIGILFTIGGDGTTRGAIRITEEIERRGLKIGVVGVPKTIDNDIHFTDRSFGFETAYSSAVHAIRAAGVEAAGAHRGIGLVKVMGRHSGFVACHAALASTDVDLVLIPEVPFKLEGANGLYATLEKILARKGHAVVVCAEGAGQEFITYDSNPPSQHHAVTDKSGNMRLSDIGAFLRDNVTEYFAADRPVTLKYIDPSYTIRSVPASPSDSVYCWNMARNAVHAAMAGNTQMLIGRWHGRFVHVPMPLATRARKLVDPNGELWMSVVESTGQPRSLIG